MKKLLSSVPVVVCIGIVSLCILNNTKAQDVYAPNSGIIYAHGEWTDANIRSIFNHLSEISGTDFVIDPNVNGKVTLSVKNKTWREMVDIVCRMKQLIPIQESNYIFIMNEKDYVSQIQDKETGKKNLSEVRELEREIVTVANTSAAEMLEAVKELLSSRGKITIVKHNNSLIIYDIKDNIEKIRAMIEQLDIEVEQIQISSRIMEVSTGAQNNLGVQWSLFGGKIEHLPGATILGSALEKASYGILAPQKYAIALEYLFSESKSNIVAQPQITTLDNKEARIFMGSQVPLAYKDESGNTVVKMIDAGTELVVTPHITREGRILLDLKPKKKSYQFAGNGLPVINEQSAQTNVVVNDGETVVIAGLSSDEVIKSEGGLPLLKSLPFVGFLFKKSSNSKDKKELVVFVTPRIIKRSVAALSPIKESSDAIVDSTTNW
ncbi:MAG: hypothetical protein JW795_06785 [Chitinivibrionales bacterium]|nr:hypothetical protein [Chitinivibrionales bacterium]